MKVVLVTHDSVYGRYFAAALAETGVVDRVVVETHRAPLSFYWRKLRKVGIVDFGFQYWLNKWFASEGARALPARTLPPHELVPSINTLSFAPEELVLGFGTSYVTPRTLARAPNGILNLHTGVLPQYRGVKSEFWALQNRDPTGLGWTLHYMTKQLDAGDVVLRGAISPRGDNPAQARARLLMNAVPAIAELLATVRSGATALAATPQNSAHGSYYSTPTWRDWRRGRAAWEIRQRP